MAVATTTTTTDSEYPYSLTLTLPFPTARLASIALRALRVDPELSNLVRRTLSLAAPTSPPSPPPASKQEREREEEEGGEDVTKKVLRVVYEAKTNRMLRVAVNSFMDGLALVLDVMAELDDDVVVASAGS